MRRAFGYISLLLAAWILVGGLLALAVGVFWKLILIPEFWIPLAVNFAIAFALVALGWYLLAFIKK